MNTLQFLEYLRPFLAQRDMGAFNASERQTLVRAINLTQIHWWDAAPMSRSNQPFSILAPSSRQVTLTVTQGSSAMTVTSSPPLAESDIGRSLVLTGDNVRNTILAPDTMLLPYNGPSGSVTATVYGDAFGMPDGFERLTGTVWLEVNSGAPRKPLYRIDESLIYFLEPVPFFSQSPMPSWYSIGPLQTLAGVEPFQVMRIYPIPSTGVRVSFSYSGLPASWTIQDLVTARPLGLDDRAWIAMVDVVIQNLILTGLLRTDLEKPASIDRLDKRAESAMQTISRTPDIEREPIWVGSEPGY
jgi:hypothetical protein